MIFKPEMVEKILAGEKTVTRRPVEFYWDETWEQTALAPCRYEVGKTYAVQPGRGKKRVGRIRIVDVRRGLNVLEDLADAQAEGFRRIEDFVNYWIALYGDYDSTQLVDRIEFELVEPNKQREAGR